MLSSNALKYKIKVSPSIYAGVTVFLLYLSLILLSLLLVSITIMTAPVYIILLALILVGVKKAYVQTCELLVSDSGLLEIELGGRTDSGVISSRSFYNSIFISLHFDVTVSLFTKKSTKRFVTVYKDAISEEHYRLLARLINSTRD